MKGYRVKLFKPELIPLVLKKRKTVTSRTKAYNGIYEIATSTGRRWRYNRTGILIQLTPIARLSKEQIAIQYWYEEGCNSPRECLELLNSIYPKESLLYVHLIKVLRGGNERPRTL